MKTAPAAALLVGLLWFAPSCRSTAGALPPADPSGPPASAASGDKAGGDVEAAKRAYSEGKAAYDQGQVKEALASFQRANQLHPDPTLLYNIGQSYWKLGDAAQAIAHYRGYLAKMPDASNRAKVEQKIADLLKQIESGKAK